MAISCATQSANELCKYYWGPQSVSVTAGKLRRNGQRLQVADIIVLRAASSTVQGKLNNLYPHFSSRSLTKQNYILLFHYKKNIMKQKALVC